MVVKFSGLRRFVLKIGVVSDTHAYSIEDIPRKVVDSLSKVDLIVHAGDFTSVRVLDGLKRLGELKAVQGNMDSMEIRSKLPIKEIVEVGGKRIGITHGSGGPWGMEQRVRKMFDQVDVIVYGHSHESQNKVIDGILFFNPGKASDSFGILMVEEDVKGEIISSR
ncbi:MAG: YfcE family phosphodiesterase [Dehalococcoidia bacterium]|nr:MAG: YfcE family phosphodiesterase [Dehalococcoidia bacterium]